MLGTAKLYAIVYFFLLSFDDWICTLVGMSLMNETISEVVPVEVAFAFNAMQTESAELILAIFSLRTLIVSK